MYYNDYEDYMRNVLGYSNPNNSTYQNFSNNYNMDYNMNYSNMNYDRMNCNNPNYDNMMCCNMPTNQFQNRNNSTSENQIEQMYPEIYKIINPMVCQKCDNNTQPVTEYLIDQMTNEIYDNVVNRVEIQNVININVETREADTKENRGEANNSSVSSSISNNRSISSSSSNNMNVSTTNSSKNSTNSHQKVKENIEETRETRLPSEQNQSRRRNTLLRDLIRILILNRLLRPNRPNRPPFGPGPGQGPRPPMPRMSNEYMPYM